MHPAYATRVREALRHAFWPNFTSQGYRKLSPTEVAAITNESYTGLALSRTEGVYKASVEFLLCGVPVITTPYRDGRDAFYSPVTTRIVPATPSAIASTVQEVKRHAPPPDVIRQITLGKIWEHRMIFATTVSSLSDNRFPPTQVLHWLREQPNKLKRYFAPELREKEFSRQSPTLDAL
ncbi:hypothetical protein JCM19992_17640 [Thermostilla marina]